MFRVSGVSIKPTGTGLVRVDLVVVGSLRMAGMAQCAQVIPGQHEFRVLRHRFDVVYIRCRLGTAFTLGVIIEKLAPQWNPLGAIVGRHYPLNILRTFDPELDVVPRVRFFLAVVATVSVCRAFWQRRIFVASIESLLWQSLMIFMAGWATTDPAALEV
jgi:hypothetical protein